MKIARLLIPPVAALAVFFLLAPFTPEQRLIGTVFAFTVALWITETLPLAVTALVSSALLIVVAGLDEKTVFSAYGDTIVPLFIGSFMLAKAMEVSGLGDRLAYLILSQRWATRSPSALLLSLGALACAISLFISNTATTAMLLPVGLSLLHALGNEDETKTYSIGIMLMLTWGSSIAVGVPVGTPPNLIAIDLIERSTGQRITFLEWMTFGMPITIAMLLACWGLLWFLYRKGAPATAAATDLARERLAALGPFTPAQRNTSIAFCVAVTLWMAPDILTLLLTKENPLAAWTSTHIPPSVAALAAASLLFLLPNPITDDRFTWKQAATIDWGTILLFAGGIALGQAMFQSGLAKELGTLAATASGAKTVLTITILCTACAILLSELASNTAAATTLVPVAIGLSEGAGISPIAPALGVALGASFGFMLPVSTAPNAIVYSSGLVPPRKMMSSGFLIDVVGFIVTVVALALILPLMGKM